MHEALHELRFDLPFCAIQGFIALQKIDQRDAIAIHVPDPDDGRQDVLVDRVVVRVELRERTRRLGAQSRFEAGALFRLECGIAHVEGAHGGVEAVREQLLDRRRAKAT